MPTPFELYRALHRGNEGDVDFYRRVAAGARTVLELGAGDGRVARALAADGLDVTALELSEEAIEIGRASAEGDRVRWVSGTMERFDLGRRFDRVVAPYNAVYCLTTPAAQRSCFESVARHLAPEGLFVFDVWSAEAFHDEADEGEVPEPELVDEVEVRGEPYRVFESASWVRAEQRLGVTYTYVPSAGGEPKVSEIPQRYLLRDEVEEMLEASGLELVVAHGGFDQHVFDESSDSMIVTARLAR